MMKSHVAVVLAAGYSTRYGSDKRLSGKEVPLVVQSVTTICEHYCDVILVHRHDENLQFFECLKHLDIDLIPAQGNSIGLSSSIASVAKYILNNSAYKDASTLSIFLADMPYLQNSTIEGLLTVAERDNIVRPCYLGQQGHPVIFGKCFFEQLSLLEGDQGAKQVLQSNQQKLTFIDVNDAGCIKDIDRPKDWP